MNVKVSFNLPEPVVRAMKDLAQQRGTTVTEVVRDSISHELFFDRQINSGAKVLLQTPDRAFQQVIFPDMERSAS